MAYEVWHLPSRNIVGSFATKREALALVRDGIETHGTAYAERFMLGREDRHGEFRVIAEGADLAQLALVAPIPTRS